jgi:hypothetical protein
MEFLVFATEIDFRIMHVCVIHPVLAALKGYRACLHMHAGAFSGQAAGRIHQERQARQRNVEAVQRGAVALTRRYRAGELPDVQSLRPGSFLAPLTQV